MLVGGALLAAAVWSAGAGWHRCVAEVQARSDEIATQLDRRISELFSLQELGYILSGSLELGRIVDQVAQFAMRFLQADGAIVVLSVDGNRALRVAGAIGTLEYLLGRELPDDDDDETLLSGAMEDGRIRMTTEGAEPVALIPGLDVTAAAVAPLRSHGDRIGALAVTGRHGAAFTTEDLWLLSTVATNASVVLANGRLFEMVQRATEEWETAFNALTEGLAVVGPSGTVLRANSSLARMAGVTEAEMAGRDFAHTMFGDSDSARAVTHAARAGERPAPLVARSDVLGRVLRLTTAPLGDLAGRESIVALVEDVTEQRAMEAQLIHNEKMATIGQLVSGVAHELNNPLTSIAGLTELLLERGPLPDFPREHLRVIHDQAERAGRIVSNLLTFARKGTPENTLVDLNDVVSRTSQLIAYEMRLRGIELHADLTSDPLTVMGDRYELQQVLLNLVTNAVQAVGELEPSRPRAIWVSTARADDTAQLRVRDSGDGVRPDLVPYLFTPFFTTKEPGQGTGLGLSLSYGLIESHGGRLSYVVTPGHGAEFLIALPWMADADAAAGGASPSSMRRILVVDSDPAVHRVVSALFAGDGHAVDAARDGDEALATLEHRDYDLIIADAHLQTAAGTALLDALLARSPAIQPRLALVTAGGRPDPRCAFHLAKPLNLRELRMIAAAVFSSRPRSPATTAES